MSVAGQMGVLAGDLSDAVLNCAFPVTLIRAIPSSTGAVAKGRVNPPVEQRATIQLSVQPMNQKDLKMLPEGMRNEGSVKCYGPDRLETVDTNRCRIPDKFVHDGVTYQAQIVNNWFQLGGYYKTIAVRVIR